MKDRSIFNICAFIGMFVTMLILVKILKHVGVYISSRNMIMMIGIILSFAWFADVFFKVFFYFLAEEGLNSRWMWRHEREELSNLAKEELEEFHWGEIVAVMIVLLIGFFFINGIIAPYTEHLGMNLHIARSYLFIERFKFGTLFFIALWLGGLIMGGVLYGVFKCCSDSKKNS